MQLCTWNHLKWNILTIYRLNIKNGQGMPSARYEYQNFMMDYTCIKHALHWIRLKRSIHPSPNLDTDQIVYTKAVVIEKELGKIGSVELNEINDYERIN